MIAGNDVETLIGHPIGGVCPFAVKDNVKVYLDASMKRFRTMLPACGTPNSAIELTLEELEKLPTTLNGWMFAKFRKKTVVTIHLQQSYSSQLSFLPLPCFPLFIHTLSGF